MSTTADLFPVLQAMTYSDLIMRRKDILGDRTTVAPLSDNELDELAVIVSLLRRKSSGPPREEKPSGKSKTPKSLSNDDLFNL